MDKGYRSTIKACFTGYIVQAVVNNYVPLLFVYFHTIYNISLAKITLLVTINFGIQLLVDLLSAGVIDRIGYRVSLVASHIFVTAGLVMLTVMPDIMPDAFAGLLLAVVVYAVGGGLLEVLVSPVVEACPTDNKESVMSLLHSFYCWGHVGVVAFSTLYFVVFGIENWKMLAIIWAVLPLVNGLIFTGVPLYSLVEEDDEGMSVTELLRNKLFWFLCIMMVCAGASEQAVSQWTSAFAEAGLGVDKTIGDLAGPMFFATTMGLSRLIYSRCAEKIKLNSFMVGSAMLCVAGYLVISLSPVPALSLAGCGICGFSVGIMWPGTFSLAASRLKFGGTSLFALLALAGDLGCGGGPTYVGEFAGVMEGGLSIGILMAVIFPVMMLICLLIVGRSNNI